jgi:flagellar M-ring protein FliF
VNDNPNPLLRAFFGMDATRRFLVFGGSAVAIAVVWVLGQWAATPTFVTLYHDLELKESGQISEQLKKADIPFRLSAGGTEVMVPAADVAAARVALAREGLPSSGRPGLELFDRPTWGMTDFTQRVTYQRALEGELARTIAGIQGIEKAEVHLVMPVSSPVRRLERAASASVVLTIKPNATLSRESVQGIAYIVSNSVEQLPNENVAVMDNAGKVLSMPAQAGTAGAMTGRQLDYQHSVEQRLEEKVEDLLTTVLGYGHSRARVSAELSLEEVDRTVETFDPDGQVLQTEQRSEGGAADGSGAPQTVISNSYQNSHKVEKSQSTPGNIKRLTVAVLVDEKSAQQAGKALGPERLEAMVRDAVGADSARGDRVSVLAVPFETVAVAPGGTAATGAPKADVIRVVERASRPAIGLVAIIALILIALRALKPGAAPSAPVASASASATAGGGNGLAGAPISPLLAPRLPAEAADRAEASAQVLRAWLSES